MTELIIIAAVSKNDIIGKEGRMPWYIREDLIRFKKLTKGYPCIMGRKTYESLPVKPLPDRENIVITRQEKTIDGATIFNSIHEALNNIENNKKAFIIGGTSIYEQTIDLADTLEITRINKDFEGDKHFPKIDENEWEITKEEEKTDPKYGKYHFLTYRRKKT